MGAAADIRIEPLGASPAIIQALAAMLVEVVAAGGSVSFMHPLDPDVAADFWAGSLAEAAAGRRVVLGAWRDSELAASLTLDLATPPNQPHRADLAKMMTRLAHRGHGLARSLVIEAERLAAERGRTLLTLDTAEDEGAAGFYEKLGYVRAGLIPDYAFKPRGGLTGTILYYKRLAPAA
jgi:ribosomal protein S18 acetylase RimI-like enzyme